jgi:hypothetical protein
MHFKCETAWFEFSQTVVTPPPRFPLNLLPPLPEGFIWGQASMVAKPFGELDASYRQLLVTGGVGQAAAAG